MEVAEWISSSGEVSNTSALFILPADAFRDATMCDWIMAKTSHDESTFDDFNDLLVSKFNEKVAHGGLKGLAAYEARATGMASYKVSGSIDASIEGKSDVTEKNLL